MTKTIGCVQHDCAECKKREAQTGNAVYLVATGEITNGMEQYTRHDVCPPLCDAEKLFTHPTPPPSGESEALQDDFYLRGELARYLSCWHRLTKDEGDHLVDLFAEHVHSGEPAVKQFLSTERKALIKVLRSDYSEGCIDLNAIRQAADMLAADAQELESLRVLLNYEYTKRKAQQVAVPQEKGMTSEKAAHFMRRFKSEEKLLGPNEQNAIDYVLVMLAAAPQPPQGE